MRSSPRIQKSVATRKQFCEGDLVEVSTVDRAAGKGATNRRPKPARKERWRAVVVGPSVLGTGWWMVKKLSGVVARG